MQLLRKQIIVIPVEPEEKTSSGIFIPQTSMKPRNRGTVTHIGTEVDENLLNKEVLFHHQSAQKFEHEDISGLLIFETDIIATLN